MSKYKSSPPPRGLYLEGLFNGGFFALRVWGAFIWRADTWRGLFSEFYSIRNVKNLLVGVTLKKQALNKLLEQYLKKNRF